MPKGVYARQPRDEAPPEPRKIRLTHRHGFIDHNNRTRTWEAGDVIDDPAEVALLLRRGASHEVI
jgi:hypothetical protein